VNSMTMRRAYTEHRLWDIASVAATLWTFFSDVDFVPTTSRLRGFLIARDPRGLDPEQYSKLPTIAIKSD